MTNEYIVSLLTEVDFAPNSVVSEILQNVRTIISTRKGTVPLDRELGVSWEHLDLPLPISRARMASEIVTALNKYEPRATVTDIRYTNDISDSIDGLLLPAVKIKIDERSLS